ncbi:hypothetical protein [Acinetobacter chengduensis]|uniref:Lipoprotein n=1 Tax=Acinetobacter chengduensis TaxID=2420890 RepID=A0ABX9TS62_9GAMM|nr:hypothetical protein [Acinetobacter chengduensis]RLL17870.1 hypothetical protein D9K81_16495 [Acinetobacter chengduensis]
MKKIIILGLFLLAGCTGQEAQKVENSASSEIVPYINKSYSESDSAAKIDFIQLTQLAINNLSSMQAGYNSDATEVKFLSKEVPPDAKFLPSQDWQSVKISRNKDSEIWKSFIVEVFDSKNYEQSKTTSFSICKDIWKDIDNRVPTVIDELAVKINENEKVGSTPATQHIRYGYFFNLDATHYKDGYPVVCAISYAKK